MSIAGFALPFGISTRTFHHGIGDEMEAALELAQYYVPTRKKSRRSNFPSDEYGFVVDRVWRSIHFAIIQQITT